MTDAAPDAIPAATDSAPVANSWTKARWARVISALITGVASIVAVLVHNYREDHADPGVLSIVSSAATDINTLHQFEIGMIFSGYDVYNAISRNSNGVQLQVNMVDDAHYEITDEHGRHPACLTVMVTPGDLLSADRVYATATEGPCPHPSGPTASPE